MLDDKQFILIILTLVSLYKINKRQEDDHETNEYFDMISDMAKFTVLNVVLYFMYSNKKNNIKELFGLWITVIISLLFYYQVILTQLQKYNESYIELEEFDELFEEEE